MQYSQFNETCVVSWFLLGRFVAFASEVFRLQTFRIRCEAVANRQLEWHLAHIQSKYVMLRYSQTTLISNNKQ